MKSDLPKVLHPQCGRPMIEFVLDAVRSVGVKRIIVVVGYRAELVQQALSDQNDVEFALQEEQHGTGHAVLVCQPILSDHDGPVLVLAGDTPLLKSDSLAVLLGEQRQHQAACVVGTAETAANKGLGRIVRDTNGEFLRIVEQKDATSAEAAIREVNTGCYVFDGRLLFEALSEIRPANRQGEYYLTDCPAILKREGKRVVAACRLDIQEAMGVNTPAQMADVERALRRRAASA